MTRQSFHGALRLAALSTLLSACGFDLFDRLDPIDPPEPQPCTRTITDSIATATTWAPVTDGCDYTVEGIVEVRAALKVEPGTLVRFGSGAGLLVTPTGSLNAVGTEARPILFNAKADQPGYWRGVAFRSNDPANALEFVTLSHAGNKQPFCCDYFHGPAGSVQVTAAVVVGASQLESASQVRLSRLTVEKSGNEGLFAFNRARLPGFERNVFRDNVGNAVSVSLSNVGALDGASTYSQRNGGNFVRVFDAPDADSMGTQTLRKLDVPYGMSTGIPDTVMAYGGALTLEPGARLEFEADTGLIITSTGSLVANGTASNRIALTSRVQTPGSWKGLSIRSRDAANLLNHVDLTNAGGSVHCCDYFTGPGGRLDVKAALSVGGMSSAGAGRVTLSNSTVSGSPEWGVFVFKNSGATLSGVTYSGNGTNFEDENTAAP